LVTYYDNQADVIAQTNPLPNNYSNTNAKPNVLFGLILLPLWPLQIVVLLVRLI
jgi:hypothetical protein